MAKKIEKPRVTRSLSDLSGLIAPEVLTEETVPEQPRVLTPQEKKSIFNEYRNSTYLIVSIVAYLIGIGEERFGETGVALFRRDKYDELEKDRDAKLIRSISRVRALLMMNRGPVSRCFANELKNIGSIPDLIPTDCVTYLQEQGIRLYKSRPDIDEYLITLNNEMSNRIGKAAAFFPEWVKWEYIRPLFLMPDGTKKDGVKRADAVYNQDRNRYPFHIWINWSAISGGDARRGNILYDDEKFVRILYEHNEDLFENLSLVRDVGNSTMRNLEMLLEGCRKCLIVVDCENSNAVKLAAALSSLPAAQLEKITKILLFDSDYTTDQWRTLVDRYLNMAVSGCAQPRLEHTSVGRLNQSKSQVDLTLATRTCKEVYTNDVDAVLLVSSDSDYWAMIQSLDGVRFLMMMEKQKTGQAIVDMLLAHEVPFCFIDDFCTGASYSIKTSTLVSSIQQMADRILSGQESRPFNVRQMMADALRDSWIIMTDKEKESFYNRYLAHLKFSVALDGAVTVDIDG